MRKSKIKTYPIPIAFATAIRQHRLQLSPGSVMGDLVQAAEKQTGAEKGLIQKGLQKTGKWKAQYPELDVDKLEMLLKQAIGG